MGKRLLNKPRPPPIHKIAVETPRIEPAGATGCCEERGKSMYKFKIRAEGLRPASRKMCRLNGTGLQRQRNIFNEIYGERFDESPLE